MGGRVDLRSFGGMSGRPHCATSWRSLIARRTSHNRRIAAVRSRWRNATVAPGAPIELSVGNGRSLQGAHVPEKYSDIGQNGFVLFALQKDAYHSAIEFELLDCVCYEFGESRRTENFIVFAVVRGGEPRE